MEFMEMEMEMEMTSLGDEETIHVYQGSSDFSGPQTDTDTNNLEPYEGMVFESEEAAKAFYNSYARRIGFSTRVSMSRRSRRDGAIIQRSFVCAKEGFRVDKDNPLPRLKRPRAQTRVGCKALMVVKIQDPGRWVVSSFVKEHNHELVPPDKVHCLRSHRHVSGSAKSLIDTLQGAGIGPSGIMSALIKEYGGISNTLTFSTKLENEDAVTTYRIAKFGESNKAYLVSFNVREMKVTCSCQMFEYSGLLCRHILAVFRVTNVLTLPSRYVLKRWTRNAKSGVILEDHTSNFFDGSKESLTVRYNNLRHEALKYVDKGYKSTDIYNVAMDALREAANKVALAEKNGGKVAVSNRHCGEDHKLQRNQTNTTSQDHQWCSQQPASEDDQDRKIHKLSVKLERAKRKCELYRANLLSLLKDMEGQKLQLSVKVQNIKLGMKD
ncbi:hypothetical protein JRO89_XS08G0099600 [Xanthoceras sorbifolium]|uniref:Protein FAR1-RELATED SEQUENCE n=1 Tax=Xanthoceras sorbifolium TaxID=99658 RepID=A0ABQ8HPF0_9ROSI|nr:hypothetical protein JRO89_XS08G0099600 [Xanthoceras sorbifolium]